MSCMKNPDKPPCPNVKDKGYKRDYGIAPCRKNGYCGITGEKIKSKYHVHIYKVEEVKEVDVIANNSVEAKRKAYEKFDKKPGEEYIAIDYELEWEDGYNK